MLRLILAFAIVLSLAACGTRLNPFNWFGNDREEVIAVAEGPTARADGRMLVAELISLDVDPVPQGAIIRAMGRPPVQGFWDAELVEVERTDGSIVYEFRVMEPTSPTRTSTPASREIVVGATLSNIALQGIRTITVVAAQNRRTVSRR